MGNPLESLPPQLSQAVVRAFERLSNRKRTGTGDVIAMTRAFAEIRAMELAGHISASEARLARRELKRANDVETSAVRRRLCRLPTDGQLRRSLHAKNSVERS